LGGPFGWVSFFSPKLTARSAPLVNNLDGLCYLDGLCAGIANRAKFLEPLFGVHGQCEFA